MQINSLFFPIKIHFSILNSCNLLASLTKILILLYIKTFVAPILFLSQAWISAKVPCWEANSSIVVLSRKIVESMLLSSL